MINESEFRQKLKQRAIEIGYDPEQAMTLFDVACHNYELDEVSRQKEDHKYYSAYHITMNNLDRLENRK